GMIIFPVVLSPCEWNRYDWLASRQFLPGGDETIEENYTDPGRRKRLFLKIRQELRSAIGRVREHRVELQKSTADRKLEIAERRQLTAVVCELIPTEIEGPPLDPDDLPEIVHEIAPEFRKACSQIFAQFEGQIDPGSGGIVTGYFGHPAVHEDDSRRAVRAALAILRGALPGCAHFEKELNVRLTVRIGVHSGMIIVSASEGVAETDTVITAHRLQEMAPENSVVMSEATLRLAGEFFETEEITSLSLSRGRQVRVFRVLRDSGGHSRIHAGVQLTQLVGRAEEMALLLSRWSDARNGKGHVLMLRAEAGIGKSRLLAEVLARTSDEDRLWVECRCSPYHQNSSFFPIVGLFEKWFGFEAGDDDETKLTKIEQIVLRFGSAEDIVPPLASMLAVPFEHKYPRISANPLEQKRFMLEVMVQLLIDLSLEKPLLLVMEDLHWSDPSTIEFLNLLIEQVVTLPILVLLTSRPEYNLPAQWMGREYVSQISIEKLGRDDVMQMVLSITGGKSLPIEVFDEIFAKTEGFPLFLEDLTRMVMESELFVAHEDHYELIGPFQSLAIPATLQETLMARLAKLTTAKRVAQIGAIIGREFSLDMLRDVGGFGEKELQEEIDRLVAAGLLYRRGFLSRTRYVFKHALVQEALQQSLLKRERRECHKIIAEVLEEKFRDIAATQPEVVAYHFRKGHVPLKAVEYWKRAAQQALAGGANREALAHARKAIETLQSQPDDEDRCAHELGLRMIEGPALLALRGWASTEVGSCYARARNLCSRLTKTRRFFPTVRGVWTNDTTAARLTQALATAEEMYAMAEEESDDDLLLESHAALCDTLFWLGRPAEAVTHANAGFALYNVERHHIPHCVAYGEDPSTMFFTYSALSLSLLGLRQEALETVQRAEEMLERFTHAHSRCFLLAGIAWTYIERADPENAFRFAQTLLELALAHHLEAWNALGTFFKGWSLAAFGTIDDGMTLMRDGRERWHALGAGVQASWFPSKIAALALRDGRLDIARDWIATGFEGANACDDRYYLSELHRLNAELHVALADDEQEIQRAYDASLTISQEQNAALLHLRTALSKARMLTNHDRVAEAGALLHPICHVYAGDTDTPELLDARQLLLSAVGAGA
ncbi:MAG: hypothetical protein QOE68_3011, partial [Thermoanaerobaculia bacterium]|nr:hypothetical protein [Thermoanaerobaculia bacterium]